MARGDAPVIVARRCVHERLGEAAVPVLVLTGDSDAVAPPEAGALVAGGVRDGRQVVLPRAARQAPRDTARALIDFVHRREEHP